MTVEASISESDITLRFRHGTATISPDAWALAADAAGRAAVDALRRCELRGEAIIDADGALLEHSGAASLAPAEAAALGLPPTTDAVLSLTMRGVLPGTEIEARWLHPSGMPILNPARCGAFLRIGTRKARLPEPLFGIVIALEAFQAAPRNDPDERTFRLVSLKARLPEVPDARITASGAILSIHIAYAEAFTLDSDGDALDPHPVPVLQHRAREGEPTEGAPPAPLLPEPYQSGFTHTRFLATTKARAAYALGNGWYVALSRPLQSALQVVREMYDAPVSQRRAFLRNPRPWLKDRLGAEYDETVIESLFRETAAYSDRVIGLGLWQPRVVPWLKRPTSDWFGPPEYGLDIGGKRIPVPADELAGLPDRIDAAMAGGEPVVRVPEPDGPAIPATPEARTAAIALIAEHEAERSGHPPGPSGDGAPVRTGTNVLLIAPNEETAEYERGFIQRAPLPADTIPACVHTCLKQHQKEGLDWLRRSWNAGRPGVLLADDMGLGKTLQCLAFLALLRSEARASRSQRRPFLVVAPVGLLANWSAEHDQHLGDGGLGPVCRAYGADLAKLRIPQPDGAGPRRLDISLLQNSNWVLTTYETLRDNQRDFGEVHFAVAVFDEAQRIKTPAARVTDAAKAMKADFVIALTGTPIENRLADLWCIVDTAQPGKLGELKSFSARYERAPDDQALMELKHTLEWESQATPRLMMRRLKSEKLPGLPEKREIRTERMMPPPQAEAYRRAIDAARANTTRSARLSALQRLRSISLHHDPALEADDETFIAASARVAACCDVLDRIAAKGEKALVFLDSLELQARLTGVFQRRYRMARAPLIISGEVAAVKRQDRVDAFQAGLPGFDLMLLSTRAAGVGLTLTAASHVIHLSRWWNPAVEDQCTDRIYRLGQTRDVEVHLPMALLPDAEDRSFDRTLHALLERKRKMAEGLLAAPTPTEAEEDEFYRNTVGS